MEEFIFKTENMKLNILIVILLFCTVSGAEAKNKKKKADEDTVEWRYELECVQQGQQGTYLIKVWSYSKKPDVAIEQAKKNAVHGIIFKGYAGGAQGCTTQKPLVRSTNAEIEHEAYFKSFFSDGGKYMKFISLSTDGSVAAGDRLKISKNEYKIGVVVAVHKDQLRKELENEGIVKGLSSGF